GAARALFVPLALAVGFAMVASYILSSTFVPVLSIWFLRGHPSEVQEASFFSKLQNTYVRFVRRAVTLRWVVLPVYLIVSVAVIWLVGRRLGTEIFPSVDAGQMALRLRTPTGTKVELTEQAALKVLEVIKNEAGAENIALT